MVERPAHNITRTKTSIGCLVVTDEGEFIQVDNFRPAPKRHLDAAVSQLTSKGYPVKNPETHEIYPGWKPVIDRYVAARDNKAYLQIGDQDLMKAMMDVSENF